MKEIFRKTHGLKTKTGTLITWLMVAVLLIGLIPSAFAAEAAPVVCDAFGIDGGLIALMSDGTVRVVEDERLQADYFRASYTCEECAGWSDIVQICASRTIVVGLRSDGTVLSEGPEESVSELEKWDQVTELYTLDGDYDMVAGLRKNGDVIVLGIDDPFSTSFYEKIASWKNVKKMNIGICGAGAFAAALHRDGTVSFTGAVCDAGWSGKAENIVDLACSGWGLIALKEDGTCVVNGEDSLYREVTDTWKDLKQVGCGDTVAIGLRNDGTFVSTRDDYTDEFYSLRDVDHFSCSAYNRIIAYRNDGTVEYFEGGGFEGNVAVQSWTDIDRILFLYPIVVALRTDGTLISTEGEIVIE